MNMRTAPEILARIDEFYESIVSRPEMCALNPQALENTILTLEELRDFIQGWGPSENYPFPTRWAKFLLDEGYGAGPITASLYPANELTETEKLAFRKVANVLSKYLAQRSNEQLQ